MTSSHLQPLKDTTGQTMTEYAFILALIVAIVIVAVPTFASATLKLFTDFSTAAFGS
jgi:Flp pilus assembly pilin Flp